MRIYFRNGSNWIASVPSKLRIVGRIPRQRSNYFAIRPASPEVNSRDVLSNRYMRYFATFLSSCIMVWMGSTPGAAGPNVPNGVKGSVRISTGPGCAVRSTGW